MSGDAEDYDLNPDIRPGRSIEQGFQDQGGVYPRIEYIGESDVNLRARGPQSNLKETLGVRAARVSSRVYQGAARLLAEPKPGARSEYPNSSVTETKSGHVIEYDDTPGFERLNFQHRTGSKVEFLPDGSVLYKSKNNSYSFTAGDSTLVVRGVVSVVVESNAEIRVQGDANMQVDGDLNQLIQGNWNVEVNGNRNLRVHGNDKRRIAGSSLFESRGNHLRRHLGNYRERTLGDQVSEIGGSWKTTVEGSIHQRSYGEFQGSYFGGFITLNGQDAEGTDGVGAFEASTIYGVDYHGTNLYFETDASFGGNLYVTGTVHAPTFEGLAKKAEYADTAGAAPTGTPVPKTPAPADATAPTTPQDSEEQVVDVTGTSDAFILDLDRSSVTGHNIRLLNTGEVISRARNRNLRTSSKWLQDQVDSGAILDTIASGSAPSAKREGSASRVGSGTTAIGQTRAQNGNFTLPNTDRLRVRVIPEHMRLSNSIAKTSRLSPHYRVSHMVAGDNLSSALKAQLGLSIGDIATNAQLLSYNILEPLRDKYKDTWIIAEGIYNPLPEEKIDSQSLTYEFAQGLAVGIQFTIQKNTHYFDAAQWIRNNLVFDKLVLSYIDYDPTGINEPTLIVTVKPGTNAKSIWTEFNHRKVGDNLLDLSDDN